MGPPSGPKRGSASGTELGMPLSRDLAVLSGSLLKSPADPVGSRLWQDGWAPPFKERSSEDPA